VAESAKDGSSEDIKEEVYAILQEPGQTNLEEMDGLSSPEASSEKDLDPKKDNISHTTESTNPKKN